MAMTIANRVLSALVVGGTLVALTGQHANADDAACKAVLQAVIKQTAVPVHQKISTETAAARGQLLQSETMHIGDTLYMQVRGQWTTRPYDAGKAADDARQALADVEHTCSRIGSEAVGGQAAELYRVQSKKGTVSTDSNIWISTSSGLPLRQRTTTRDQGLIGMKHDVSFDYANVRAPAGVAR